VRWEAAYERNAYNPVSSSPPIRYLQGLRTNILVTAVHAVNITRDSRPKQADRGTAGLVLWLHDRAEVDGLIVEQDTPDAVTGLIMDRLTRIRSRLELVVDLHGMLDQRGIDLEIGTGGSRDSTVLTAASDLADRAKASGLCAVTDEVFRATRPDCVVTLCTQLGIPAVQIELAARIRPPKGEPVGMSAVQNTVRDWIEHV